MGTIGLRLVVPTGGWPYPTKLVGYEKEDFHQVAEAGERGSGGSGGAEGAGGAGGFGSGGSGFRFCWFRGAGGSGVGAGATWLQHNPAASLQRREVDLASGLVQARSREVFRSGVGRRSVPIGCRAEVPAVARLLTLTGTVAGKLRERFERLERLERR